MDRRDFPTDLTRLAPRPLEPEGGMDGLRTIVRWRVAEDDGFRRVVRQGRTTSAPELAFRRCAPHAPTDRRFPARPAPWP